MDLESLVCILSGPIIGGVCGLVAYTQIRTKNWSDSAKRVRILSVTIISIFVGYSCMFIVSMLIWLNLLADMFWVIFEILIFLGVVFSILDSIYKRMSQGRKQKE